MPRKSRSARPVCKAMNDCGHRLVVKRRAELVGISRGSAYCHPEPVSPTAPERAAAYQLFGNLTLLGMGTADAFSPLQHFNPGAALPARAAGIENALTHAPPFEMRMAHGCAPDDR